MKRIILQPSFSRVSILQRAMPQDALFQIPALDCPEELTLVERSLRHTPGIVRLAPDYLARSLRVEFDPDLTDTTAILQAIETSGFPVQLQMGTPAIENVEPAQFVFARIALTSAAMLTAAAILPWMIGSDHWYSTALTIAATIVAAIPVSVAAWRAIKLRTLDINVLIIIAAAGAIAIGEYYEAATVMLLFNIALWLERMSLSRAQRAIHSLVALSPTIAHRLAEDGATTDVDPAELAIGDRILVRPGERLPADGDVVSGQSSVNQAPITGESVPVEKQPGDRVFAGTLNGEGALVVKVTRRADDTTLAHIARLIDEARTARSPTERFVDAFARRYTPVVIALAVAIMVVPPVLRNLGFGWAADFDTLTWVRRGLVLLVIACPCALVISTPVTIVSGLYQATRRGILVKGGEFLEKMAGIRTVALDKTGTVTTGVLEVGEIEAFHGENRESVLAIAASLERHSEHPLAVAIVAAAKARGISSAAPEEVTALRGMGVKGRLSGDEFFLGNAKLFEQPEFRLSAADRARLLENGGTSAWLGTRERLLGVIRLADVSRSGTREAIDDLRRLGIRQIVMLTGDNVAAAKAIATPLAIDEVHAELLPEAKIDRVKSLRAKGALAMVGDGVNDAPALAAADVGIAMGGQSSDTAMETADVVLMTPDLGRVADLMRLSRRCRLLLKQNISFALGSKLVVMGLAAAGLATMWMAVAADVGASLIVVANGMRMIERSQAE